MPPRNGTRCSPSCRLSWIRPPSTTTSPSSARTLVEIVRLLVITSTVLIELCARLDTSCSIFIMIVPSSVICGVILRMMPTSWRWMVWKGLTTPPVD